MRWGALGAVVAVVVSAVPGRAQVVSASSFTVGGELGTFGELYGISGAEQRRPGATGRTYIRPRFSGFGAFTVELDLLLSTEGQTFQSARRQRLNRYGVNPDWGWGSAHLGDFTDSYSPLTFNGIGVRGAGFNVRGGVLYASVFGGRTQRAVPGGATTGRYERNVYGGRVGVGNPQGSSIELIVVRAHDDPNSLGAPEDTIPFLPTQPDTAFVEDTVSVGTDANQFAVTPQENLVVGLVGGVSLFARRLRLKAELTGSGYTRDLRAEVIDSDEILDRVPGVIQSVFTPRVSSSADYAYTFEATAKTGPATTTASVRTVNPGYVSLGTAWAQNDLREWKVNTAWRFRKWNLRVNGSQQHDNLLGQKTFTTNRERAGAAVALRVSRVWNPNLRLSYVALRNDAPPDERWISYESWMVGMSHNVTVSRRGTIRTATVDYAYRTTGDDNPLRVQSESRSHAVNARVLFGLSASINVTPTVGLVRSRFGDDGWMTRQTYGASAQYRGMRGKWMTTVTANRSQLNQTLALQAGITSRLQINQRDAITLSLRANDYDSTLPDGQNFSEFMTNIRWAHRF